MLIDTERYEMQVVQEEVEATATRHGMLRKEQ